jgi:hypothetical protein
MTIFLLHHAPPANQVLRLVLLGIVGLGKNDAIINFCQEVGGLIRSYSDLHFSLT